MMKNTIYCLILGAALLNTSCADLMDEKHDNPDAFTETKIEYLFARGAQRAIEMDYADAYNLTFRLIGNYIQTTARQEGKDRINIYQKIQDDKGRWENYYIERMSTLTEMDKIYAQLSPEEQSVYQIYIEAAKVLKAYNTAMATDFFGNMPYSEAFSARNSIYGGAVIFKPKYDSQQEIYTALLNDLKTAADYFKGVESTDEAFKRQDVIYSGNSESWYKLANSLRLRYAMRISNVDESKAKEVLSEININDCILNNIDNAYLKVSGQETAPDALWRAMNESHSTTQGYYMYAPEFMVDLMKEAQDPRLEVFFQPGADDEGAVINPNQEIIGYPSSADEAIELLNTADKNTLHEKYAVYNTVTFRKNYYLPAGIAMTAAETNFCLAEAAQRKLIAGDAAEFYTNGMILSVQQYYDFYKNSTAEGVDEELAKTDVSDETLRNWISNSTFKFDSSKALEQIATQKWLHLNILQTFENWSEYRRTDYPVLPDDRENGQLLNKENAPVRFLYPAKEASMNTDNYNAQAEFNKIDSHLWWDIQ